MTVVTQRRRWWRRTLIYSIAGVPAVATVLGLMGPWWWGFDVLANLRIQYALILLITAACCLFTREFLTAGLCLIPLAINVALIVPLYLPPSPDQLARALAVNAAAAGQWPALEVVAPPEDPEAGPAAEAVAQTSPSASAGGGEEAEEPAEAGLGEADSAMRPRRRGGRGRRGMGPRGRFADPGFAEMQGREARPSEIKIILLQLCAFDDKHDALLSYIRDHDADIMVLHNLDHMWYQELQWQVAPFQPVVAIPRRDGFGIAILSRGRLDPERPSVYAEPRMLTEGPLAVPAVEALVQWQGKSMALLCVAALPPISSSYAQARDEQLAAAGRWARGQSRPAAVIGALAATPWSWSFRQLLREGGLINSQEGYGLQSTWPAVGGLPLGQIPIDHLLFNPRLVVLARTLGPMLNLSHRPLEVTLDLAAAEAPATAPATQPAENPLKK